MKTKDILKFSLNSIRNRKLRSWLTILGIVIGVASIVILISIAQGVNQQVSSQLGGLGSDLISVSPGGQAATRFGGLGALRAPAAEARGGGGGGFGGQAGGAFGAQSGGTPKLTFADADALSRLEGVQVADARVQGRPRVSFRDRNSTIAVVGTDPTAFAEMSSAELYSGRLLSSADIYSAVLGFSIYNNTFSDYDMLNRQIIIDGKPFKVVGMLAQAGNTLATSDSTIYINIRAAKQVLTDSANPSSILVKAQAGFSPDDVAAEIQTELQNRHHVTADNPDFSVSTAASIQSAVSGITDILTIFLGGIASISLIVGGIGVANTMFMSVLERTKEIGILKSLGMKDREITEIFLMEAGIIGLIGGVAGLAVSFVVSQVLRAFGVPSALTIDLLLLGMIFSVLVGVVSGLAPARNAARLEPVEALRYE